LGEILGAEWRVHDLQTARKDRKGSPLGRSQGGRVFVRESVRVDLEELGELFVKRER